MDTHTDTPSAILESREDRLLRLVAAYCSLDSGERAALWEAYDAGGGELCPAPADPAQEGLAQGDPGTSGPLGQGAGCRGSDPFGELAALGQPGPGAQSAKAEKLRALLARHGVSKGDFHDALATDEARMLGLCLFRYRLVKRKDWAKRRVVTISYENGARWKTSTSLDLNLDYLNAYGRGPSNGEAPEFFDIPILEVDRRDQFVFFDSGDSQGGSIQLVLRHAATAMMAQTLLGAVAEECWDDDTVPLLHSGDALMTFLGRWFEDPLLPPFVQEYKRDGIVGNASLGKKRKKELLESLGSYENWLETPGSPNFMGRLKESIGRDFVGKGGAEGRGLAEEALRQVECYEGLPVFVYLVALFSVNWLACLQVPNDRKSQTIRYSYVSTRDVLQEPLGSQPRGLGGGFLLGAGRKICFPLKMLGQAESEHFTILAPEGTFFSHCQNKAPLRDKDLMVKGVKVRGADSGPLVEEGPLVIPAYVRYRGTGTEPEIQGDVSLGPEHIGVKVSGGWNAQGEPYRRVPDQGRYPGYDYELLCRLRPQLGLRAVGYCLFYALSTVLWASLFADPGFFNSVSSFAPLAAASVGAAIALDKESFLRKQMFLFPKFLALGVAAIELPALWVKAFLLPEGDWWTVLCVAMLALVLGAFSLNCLWLVRHWLNKRIARKAPDYLSRERLTLHQRTDRVTPA